jgi:hypothetical protein
VHRRGVAVVAARLAALLEQGVLRVHEPEQVADAAGRGGDAGQS